MSHKKICSYPCCECGKQSRPELGSAAARKALREDGWSRIYRGYGELFRCKECREKI